MMYLIERGDTYVEVAQVLRRSVQAVRNEASVQGIKCRTRTSPGVAKAHDGALR